MMDNLLFCRGYCLADFTTDKLPASFNKIRLDDCFYFYFHNWLDCEVVRQDKDWLVIAGTCLDIKQNTANLKEIGRFLLDLLLQNKKDEFYQHLDFLGGTFILCFSVADNVELYTDCCAIKSAFYTRRFGKTCVTSHLNIIPLVYNVDFPLSDVEVHKPAEVSYSYGYPGNDTRYKNVLLLTPNTYLDVANMEINRYFPSQDIEQGDIEQVADIIENAFSVQMSLLKKKDYEKEYLSLTSGSASYFTLVCLKEYWASLSFFTYNLDGLHQIDMDGAKSIAKARNLRDHIALEVPRTLDGIEELSFNQFNKYLSQNTNFMHGRKIAFFYYKYLTSHNKVHPKNILHIRSHLSGIGRLHYGAFGYYWEMTSKKSSVLDKIRRAYQNRSDSHPVIDKSFSEFIDRTGFNDIKNYDVFDMFYWEHRMGTFISQIAIESDPAFETISLLNVRFLLRNLLSLPVNDRHDDVLFKRVVQSNSPELMNDSTKKTCKNIFIFGSCVTRDAFTPANTDEFLVSGYVARHSLARVKHAVFDGFDLESEAVVQKIPSAFRRRMLKQDWGNSLFDTINSAMNAKGDIDFLVIDSVDERFGLIEVADNVYVTNSDEFRSGQLINSQVAKKITADSEEFFSAWEYGFQRLLEVFPREKIIYNNVLWSKCLDTGQEFEKVSTSSRVDWHNTIMKRLYTIASKYLSQDQFVNYPEEIFVGDSNHKWGKSPFHYTQDVYDYLIDFLRKK